MTDAKGMPDDFFARLAEISNNDQIDSHVQEFTGLARWLYGIYVQFYQAGFTEDQALQMTIGVMHRIG